MLFTQALLACSVDVAIAAYNAAYIQIPPDTKLKDTLEKRVEEIDGSVGQDPPPYMAYGRDINEVVQYMEKDPILNDPRSFGKAVGPNGKTLCQVITAAIRSDPRYIKAGLRPNTQVSSVTSLHSRGSDQAQHL
jgi:hypothetical protein